MSDQADHNRRLLLTALTGMVLPGAAGAASGASITRAPADGAGALPTDTRTSPTLSVQAFGALGDGRTQNGGAFLNAARALPSGGPIDIPAGTYLVGGQLFGPGRGNVHAFDHAQIGIEEVIADPNFSGLMPRWSLTGFARGAGGIVHTAGKVGRVTTTIAVRDYTTYLITVRLSTAASGGIGFTLAGQPLFTERDYSFLPPGTDSYQFAMFTYTATGEVEFGIVTDADWGGTVEHLSLKRVARETPYDFFSIAADGRNFSNVFGIKFGRFLSGNIAIGDRLTGTLFSDKAAWNVALGSRSLSTTTDGFENTAIGAFALEYNQVDRNTAGGYSSFRYNTKGIQNTGWGYKVFGRNSTGSNNTGVGFWASMYNKVGGNNSSFGALAGYYNCNGDYNSAFGSQAGLQNDGGRGNTYVGAIAGPYTAGARTFAYSYTTCVGAESKGYGNNTTAIGYQARCGSDPHTGGTAIAATATAVGWKAAASGDNALAVGGEARATDVDCTAVGDHASATGPQSTSLGFLASATAASIAIGVRAGENLASVDAVSIGNRANSFAAPRQFRNVVAIGNGARNSSDHQVVIGNDLTTKLDIGFASIRCGADERSMSRLTAIPPDRALAAVTGLRPSGWQWSNGAGDGSARACGITAQNLSAALARSGLDAADFVDSADPSRLKTDPLAIIGLLCAALNALNDKVSDLESALKRR